MPKREGNVSILGDFKDIDSTYKVLKMEVV